jgi:type II secretory ATPase GspE/PulE/Tfp pilus assembly ATPase PilB-like protein
MNNNIVILKETDKEVVLGISDVNDEKLKMKIQRSFYFFEGNSSRELLFVEISKEKCKKLISETLSKGTHEKNIIKDKQNENFSESPVVNFLEALLIECLEDSSVSDIHFEPYDGKYRIRVRKNGALVYLKSMELSLFASVSRRIKVLCNLDCGDNRQIQDGSFFYKNFSLEADIRVSFIPLYHGESVVLRLLRGNCIPPKLEDLGFSKDQVTKMKKYISKKSTLILICGATGAGKTTTLASLLSLIKEDNQKIITIEDPVEYSLPGINQIQISNKLALDYNAILRSTFRHDPDVIMIGEIRDEETAKIAIRAALTGHLVLATLHTSDCGNVVPRLLELGVKPFLLASVFGLALVQKLVTQKNGKRKAVGELLESSSDVKKLICENSASIHFDEYLHGLGTKRIWEFDDE